MKICRIISESEEDYKFLDSRLKKYPVELTSNFFVENNVETLVVGWGTVKSNYPHQNIFDKKIDNGLYWTYSKGENEKQNNIDIDLFINKSIEKWLPSNFTLYDIVFDKIDIKSFWDLNIDKNEIVFVYFDDFAMYVNNSGKNYIFNLKTYKSFCEKFKDEIKDIFNENKTVVFSYDNISPYVNVYGLNYVYSFEIINWVKHGVHVDERYFNLLPNFRVCKFIPFLMEKTLRFNFNNFERESIKRACFRDKITVWLSEQDICVNNKFFKENVHFFYNNGNKFLKVGYSNKKTITGRINPIGKYNPQNLNKSNNDRENIISRFKNGKIIVYDYTSFEARIALYLCGDENFIEKYKDKDLHYETARILFERGNINMAERDFSKTINHSLLYGSSKKSVMEKLSCFESPENKFYEIKSFLKPLLKKAFEINRFFKENGYVINSWGTIIYPNKDFAAFNNYIQSSATEVLLDKIYEIKEFLNNYKSKFLFQVHDSLVFDVSGDEKRIIPELSRKLMVYKGMYYNISYSNGKDYKNISDPIDVKCCF